MRLQPHTIRLPATALVLVAASLLPGAAASSSAAAAQKAAPRLAPPIVVGTPRIEGRMQDGGTVVARGASWRPPALPAGDRLLSFEVAYVWSTCATPSSTCRRPAGVPSIVGMSFRR